MTTTLANLEFEPLCPWFPMLYVCGAAAHVPDIEWYIRTVKDRDQSAYHMLSFCHIPCIVLIHLIKNAVLWLGSMPVHNGISGEHSPCYIMMGQELSYDKHICLEFGEYVQTHKEHTNDTVGSICLGPMGNMQGSHWFMNLVTGACISRTRWTHFPMAIFSEWPTWTGPRNGRDTHLC